MVLLLCDVAAEDKPQHTKTSLQASVEAVKEKTVIMAWQTGFDVNILYL